MPELLIFALCFALRAIPRVQVPGAISFDTCFHLYFARHIRDNGYRAPDFSLLNMPYPAYYPWAYHFLLAVFPEKARLFAERFSGAFFDLLLCIGVYLFAGIVFSGNEDACLLSLTCAFLFALSPALLRMGSGPRAYSGSPRVLGQLLYFAHVIMSYLALSTGSAWAAIGSLLAGACMAYTAKFANQVLIFFGIFLTLAWNPRYALLCIGSLVVALLLFRTSAYRVFKAQIEHSILYFTFLRHVFIGLAPRSLGAYLKSVREHGLVKLRDRKPLNFAFWCLDEQYPPHLLLVAYTPLLFAFFAGPQGLAGSAYPFLRALLMAAVFWFVATKTKLLLFLGEGERYLEYGITPVIILAVQALSGTFLLWALCAYTLIMGLVCLIRVPRKLREMRDSAQKHKEAVEFLNDLPHGPVLVFGDSNYQALLWGNKPVIGGRTEKEFRILPKDRFKLLWANYPVPDRDFEKVLETFAPMYLYGQSWAFGHYRDKITDTPEIFDSRVEKLFDNGAVQIHRIREAA